MSKSFSPKQDDSVYAPVSMEIDDRAHNNSFASRGTDKEIMIEGVRAFKHTEYQLLMTTLINDILN